MKLPDRIAAVLIFLGLLGVISLLLEPLWPIPFLRGLYLTSRSVLVVANAALLAVFLYAFVGALKFRPDFNVAREAQKRIFTLQGAIWKERWEKISGKIAPSTPDSARLAIIEADALVDEVLKQLGLQGEHMADRLAQLRPEEVSTLERLWRAHRTRNDLVHTPGFWISEAVATKTMSDYEAFLKEVEVL